MNQMRQVEHEVPAGWRERFRWRWEESGWRAEGGTGSRSRDWLSRAPREKGTPPTAAVVSNAQRQKNEKKLISLPYL